MSRPNLATRCQSCRRLLTLSHIPEAFEASRLNGADAAVLKQLAACEAKLDSVRFVQTLCTFGSEVTGLDLPLCDGCSLDYLRAVDSELVALRELERQREAFLEAVQVQLAAMEEVDPGEERALLEEERRLQAELAACEADAARLDAAGAALAKQELAVDDLQARCWRQLNTRSSERHRAQMQLLSYDRRRVRCHALLNHFHQINVFNDAFYIWHDGPFGTINGLRLGRLSTQPVEWAEINAALGYCVALLDGIATRAPCTFQKHIVIAKGSFSKVARRSDGKKLGLYSEGGFWQTRKLNTALKAFMRCVADLCKCAQSIDRSLRLPYTISNDHVSNFSVTLGDDAEWTAAMKATLTTLKWLLAWVTRNPQRGARSALFGTMQYVGGK